jgi:hypothetical protein
MTPAYWIPNKLYFKISLCRTFSVFDSKKNYASPTAEHNLAKEYTNKIEFNSFKSPD